jgi:DNA-binding beta-propeller fold protein YncE
MSIVVLALGMFLAVQAPAVHSLEKQWETPAVLKFPEGLVLDRAGGFLYVTNTDGNPLEKDEKGSIGKVGLDGTVIETEWVTGLDAPKGLAEHGNLLYAADLDQVVVVDTQKAAIVRRIPIEGARLLHNVAVDPDGVVYVSDLFAGKVFRIDGSDVSTYVDGLTSPAGIVVSGPDLDVFTGDGLVAVSPDKTVTVVSKGMDGRANGLARVNDEDFIATSWGGIVYYIAGDGSNQVLLDTTADHVPAGINLYDPATRTMYMTTDEHNAVVAFRVK